MKAILSYLIIVKILYYCNKNASYVNLQQILRPQSFQKERNMSKEEEEAKEPPLTFSLQVHNSTIPCSKRVVLSSSLLVDIMELIKDDLDRLVVVNNIILFIFSSCSPIPIPKFITKQIVLDWTEMVEKGDFECAHLGEFW